MNPSQAEILDDPATTVEHGGRIKKKGLLRRFYLDNYRLFTTAIAGTPAGIVLELGSGGGFIKEVIPEAITSDVMELPECDLVVSAESLPFPDNSIRAVVMQDVIHHIKNVEAFFRELERCLAPGGKMVAVEPASTWWGRFIWKNLHHEPYRPNSDWKIPELGPMSGANGALPWIVFTRDRERFEREFPQLKISKLEDHTPFLYLASGGVRSWTLLPGSAYTIIRSLERGIERLGIHMGLFLTIELVKEPPAS
jgi:SAM-dependent methyltransferase